MLALLGDSHTRSYKVSSYVAVRIFLAQGQKNNFKSTLNFTLTTIRYLSAAKKLKKGGLRLGFIIGEPDVRWVTYGNWFIAKGENVLVSEPRLHFDRQALDRLAGRFKLFMVITGFLKHSPSVVIGCGTPNPEMVPAGQYFNDKLSQVCEDVGCLFFDPQKFSVSDNGAVKKKFIGYSVFDSAQKDHTHLSTEISHYFGHFLSEHYCVGTGLPVDWREKSDFSNSFIEVHNFETYKPVDSGISRFFKKLNRAFRALLRIVTKS